MRYSVLGFRSDIGIELQAPVVKPGNGPKSESNITMSFLPRFFLFLKEQINYIKQHSLQGVMFNISLVLISILRSTINDILSKFHSLTKVLSLLIYIVSSRIIQ